MVNTSHSRSVHGTLSHPDRPYSSPSPPSLSDATSLTPENTSFPLPPHDSAPPPSSSPAASASPTTADSSSSSHTDSPSPKAPTPSTPYRTLGTAAGGGDKRAVGNRAEAAAEGTSRDSAKDTPRDTARAKSEEGKGEQDLHSRHVRGTLGTKKPEAKPEKTMLGDPASLIPESAGTEGGMDKGAEREGVRKKERGSKL